MLLRKMLECVECFVVVLFWFSRNWVLRFGLCCIISMVFLVGRLVMFCKMLVGRFILGEVFLVIVGLVMVGIMLVLFFGVLMGILRWVLYWE